jgi:hypothetical protein
VAVFDVEADEPVGPSDRSQLPYGHTDIEKTPVRMCRSAGIWHAFGLLLRVESVALVASDMAPDPVARSRRRASRGVT